MPPRRSLRLISWMKLSLGVVKLSVDGCSWGNPNMASTNGVLRDHQGVVLVTFGSFLGLLRLLSLNHSKTHESW